MYKLRYLQLTRAERDRFRRKMILESLLERLVIYLPCLLVAVAIAWAVNATTPKTTLGDASHRYGATGWHVLKAANGTVTLWK